MNVVTQNNDNDIEEKLKQQGLSKVIRKKNYLEFRPYDDQPMSVRPELPKDLGYYFLMQNCDVKLIRHTLEDNGFRDIQTKETENLSNSWTIQWNVIPIIDYSVYERLRQYQKINHFPGAFFLERKELIYKQL